MKMGANWWWKYRASQKPGWTLMGGPIFQGKKNSMKGKPAKLPGELYGELKHVEERSKDD